MDIKAQIEKVVETVTKDKSLLTQFQTEPVKAVEKVLGIDLPDDIINKVVDGVKTKITADKISDTFLKKMPGLIQKSPGFLSILNNQYHILPARHTYRCWRKSPGSAPRLLRASCINFSASSSSYASRRSCAFWHDSRRFCGME